MGLCLLDLLPENALQCDCIRRKLADTFSELLNRHLLLIEVEAEQRFVVDISALGNVQLVGIISEQLLGHLVCRVIEVLEQVRGDC